MINKAIRVLKLPVVNYDGTPIQMVRAQQNDANSRIIKAVLFDDIGYVDLEGYKLTLKCTLANGEKKIYGENTTEEKYKIDIYEQDGVRITYATAYIPTEIMAEKGSVACELSFTKQESKGVITQLTSQTFYVLVDESQIGNIPSDDENYNLLEDIVLNEKKRIEAEKTRVANEEARVTAERTRVDAETKRSEAETIRNSNEEKRKTAETTRVEAEKQRVQHESARNTKEQERVAAEKTRVEKETQRQNAETGRVNAENKRVASETERQEEYSTLKGKLEDAVDSVKGLTQPIDNSEAGNIGAPSLEIDPVTGGLVVKNLKGETGHTPPVQKIPDTQDYVTNLNKVLKFPASLVSKPVVAGDMLVMYSNYSTYVHCASVEVTRANYTDNATEYFDGRILSAMNIKGEPGENGTNGRDGADGKDGAPGRMLPFQREMLAGTDLRQNINKTIRLRASAVSGEPKLGDCIGLVTYLLEVVEAGTKVTDVQQGMIQVTRETFLENGQNYIEGRVIFAVSILGAQGLPGRDGVNGKDGKDGDPNVQVLTSDEYLDLLKNGTFDPNRLYFVKGTSDGTLKVEATITKSAISETLGITLEQLQTLVEIARICKVETFKPIQSNGTYGSEVTCLSAPGFNVI